MLQPEVANYARVDVIYSGPCPNNTKDLLILQKPVDAKFSFFFKLRYIITIPAYNNENKLMVLRT